MRADVEVKELQRKGTVYLVARRKGSHGGRSWNLNKRETLRLAAEKRRNEAIRTRHEKACAEADALRAERDRLVAVYRAQRLARELL